MGTGTWRVRRPPSPAYLGRCRLRAAMAQGHGVHREAQGAQGQRRVAGSGQGAAQDPGPSRGRVTHLSARRSRQPLTDPRRRRWPGPGSSSAPRPARRPPAPGGRLSGWATSQVRDRDLPVRCPCCPGGGNLPPFPLAQGRGHPAASPFAPVAPSKVCTTPKPPVNQHGGLEAVTSEAPLPRGTLKPSQSSQRLSAAAQGESQHAGWPCSLLHW